MTPEPRFDDLAQRAARAAEVLRNARCVCVSTGAGMSADSGVPTFRDAAGLWSKFDPQELATPQAFARDPRKVWAWYRSRRAELARVQPHAGHALLAEWEKRFNARPRDPADAHSNAARDAGGPDPAFTLVTQNVDGLHHRAGSQHVIELHGRLDLARCTACEYHVRGLNDLGEDPRCPECAARLRPGVVWFNEPLPHNAFLHAHEAARRCDVMLLIGTSGVVQPAASLIDAALAYGARLIEVNPNPTPCSGRADVRLAAGCAVALAAIEVAWNQQMR